MRYRMAPGIDIVVNGKPSQVPEGATIGALLGMLGIDRARVAVERNRDVVPRRSFDEVTLAPGDRLEIVTFVGGG